MIGNRLIKILSTTEAGYEKPITTEQSENFDHYEIKAKVKEISTLKLEEDFKSAFIQNEDDQFELIVTIGEFDPIIISSSNLDLDDFSQKLSNDIDYKETQVDILIKYSIFKNREDNIIRVYELKAFEEYLCSLDLNQILSTFNKKKNESNELIFEIIDKSKNIEFKSSSIIFTNGSIPESGFSNQKEITKRKQKRNELCHFENSALYNFLPEEFLMEGNDNGFQDLFSLFSRLQIIFSVVSILDISRFESNDIYLTLKGYKSRKLIWNYLSISINSETTWFKIYDWIYNSGETVDKIGLTRNVISLHIDNDLQANLKGNPYFSIISGFEIYLKENVRQYIEIKNKLSDNIINLSNKANSIINSFASNFKRSILTFVTFFASLIILKILSKDTPELGISYEASILSYAFLVVVLIYLVFSLWELSLEKKRFINNYENLKDRYRDLLIEEDLNKILNNDKDHKSDLKYIEDKRNAYTIIWICLIIVFLIAILILSK